MTLTIPCGRAFDVAEPWNPRHLMICDEKNWLCPYCNAIRQLRATCLGVADRLEQFASLTLQRGGPNAHAELMKSVGRLRADVARVEGKTS